MKTHQLQVVIPEDHKIALKLTLPADLPAGPAEIIVHVEPGRKTRAEGEPKPRAIETASPFWQRAAELRAATRGRKSTPSEDLLREDRDRDHREGSR